MSILFHKQFLNGLILLAWTVAQPNHDMIEQGRMQYQLLQERKHLPGYGNCWKSALEHIEGSCQTLSEETQSSIALHLANCFLEMSGHESYNCELEKKQNLRHICISSMSDRAFNVYTEFFTHTQNICWFLRDQIWHEMIAENTFRVGKQLEQSAKNQENILRIQKESLDVQENVLRHSRDLEKMIIEFYASVLFHQESISSMSEWVGTVVFYVSTLILIIVLTSTKQTASARFPLWILMMLNIVVETSISAYIVKGNGDDLYKSVAKYTWWIRRSFYVLSFFTIVYFAYSYKDLNVINSNLLQNIYKQNMILLSHFDGAKKEDRESTHSVNVYEKEELKKSSHNTPLRHSPCASESRKDFVKDNVDNNKSFTSKIQRYNLRSKSRSPWSTY